MRWSDNVEEFVKAALSPAEVASVKILSPEDKKVEVIVSDDQLSLAIGKNGQNVRLASKLTGWQLEIKTRAQLEAPDLSLQRLPGVGPAMEKKLIDAGAADVTRLSGMTVEQLTAVEGVGEKTAQKLLEAAVAMLALARQKPQAEEGGDASAQSRPAEAQGGEPAERSDQTDKTEGIG